MAQNIPKDILVGRITGAHGIRGAVKLVSFTATPAAIASYGDLRGADGRTFRIQRMKPAKDEFIADLVGITDRTVAEALAGTELFVPRDHLPPPAPGEFYLADLVGKEVQAGGVALGQVVGLQNYGAGDLLELAQGALVPVRFIVSVTDTIGVDLPPGFLEEASHEDRHH